MLPNKNARVLLVEPDCIIAQALTLCLIQEGYLVDIAHSAAEAELAGISKPHVLIIEPYLGAEMEGARAANTILSFSPHTEVIFLSAWNLDKAKTLLIKKPYECINKPYQDHEIVEVVNKCVKAIKSTASDKQLSY